MRKILLPLLVACALGAVLVSVQAQSASRVFGTLSANLTNGTSTPITCTQSGNGCFLDVSVGGGSFPNGQTTTVGTGTATATIIGTLTTNTTSTGTAADVNETDLWTYTLPANALSANGRGVRITVHVTTAADANAKTIRVYFGGTPIANSATVLTAPNNVGYYAVLTVIRTGASAQVMFGVQNLSTAAIAQNTTTLAIDTTAAIVIKLTGQNGVATANDVVFKAAMVESVGSP